VYHSDRLLSHDPEEHLDLQDLFEASSDTNPTLAQHHITGTNDGDYGPYPNRSSFLLGDWYWSHGAQKSCESFWKLLGVVTDPKFHSDDVRHNQWRKIDTQLGVNDFDGENANTDDDVEWLDADAQWKKTPIHISIPFNHRSQNVGPKDFYVGDLHHHPLVSVIREKLANAANDQHFHYEPFELFWKPTTESPDARVYGEIYMSSAYIDANQTLQLSPGEPGCNLPRVLVAMMFSSDATHLMNFGTAKLWPCYLFFGNESKYCRCKPTCELCNHVAYFQAVSIQNWLCIGVVFSGFAFSASRCIRGLRKWESRRETT